MEVLLTFNRGTTVVVLLRRTPTFPYSRCIMRRLLERSRSRAWFEAIARLRQRDDIHLCNCRMPNTLLTPLSKNWHEMLLESSRTIPASSTLRFCKAITMRLRHAYNRRHAGGRDVLFEITVLQLLNRMCWKQPSHHGQSLSVSSAAGIRRQIEEWPTDSSTRTRLGEQKWL